VSDLVLTGARVVTPDEDHASGWVAISEGRIDAVGGIADAPPPAAQALALDGRIVVPGFVDLHVHGGGGAQFTDGDPDACVRAARFHAAHGTTALLATTVTASPDALLAAVRAIAEAMAGEPLIVGAHLEGPWLSHERRGAQDPAHLRPPDVAELAELVDAAAGNVRMVSLAPELPGAIATIEAAVAAGAVAALAHTDATYDQAIAAVEAGARHAVHTFNGMRPLHHREPGVIGAVLDRSEVTCEVIADGLHVHPAAIRLVARAKGDGLVLVTDAIEAAGLGDGAYRLGGGVVEVRNGRAVTPEGSLAGSTLTMDAAVRNAHRWLGVDLAAAVALATRHPARVIGLEGRKGRLAPGHDADLVVLDEALRPVATMVGGRWATAPLS
jgi:N-acetylglucosamine-6-phosphate deacetylase